MKFERRSARAARWPLPLQLSSQLSSRQHHCDYSVWRLKATRAKQQHGRLTRLIERAFVGRGFTDLEPRPAKARYFQSKDALVPCHRNPPQNSAASPARDTVESCGEHARSEPARGLLFLWPVLETDHSGQRNVTSAPARAPHSGCMRRDGREGFHAARVVRHDLCETLDRRRIRTHCQHRHAWSRRASYPLRAVCPPLRRLTILA